MIEIVVITAFAIVALVVGLSVAVSKADRWLSEFIARKILK